MMWIVLWAVLFFAAFATFCAVSALIAWKGVSDLRQLFASLRQRREEHRL